MNAIESLIPQNQIEPLKKQLEKYYLPAFSVDDTHAPEVFVISVYKRPYTDSTCAIIRITRQAIAVSNETPEPPLGKAIADGDVDFAGGIELKPSYHTSSDIKDGTWKLGPNGTKITEVPVRHIETIACTKGWWDPIVAENRVINAKIFSKVVQDSFRILSEEDRDKLKEKYEEVELEIDDYIQVLSSLDAIKADTIDKIKSAAMAHDSYFLQTRPDNLRDTRGLPVMIRQAFYDIFALKFRIKEKTNTNKRGAGSSAARDKRIALGGDNLQRPIHLSPQESGEGAGIVPLAESAYASIIGKLRTLDTTDNVPFEPIFVRPTLIGSNDADSFDSDLLALKGRPIFGTSSQNPWINQWYFENVIKKMGDKEPNFDNLNVYIDNLDQKISTLFQYFNYHVGKGGHLLAHQAMMRSILSLCESNLDVSPYAPQEVGGQGRNIFDLMGKSAVLGPQGTVPYPNRLENNDDPEKAPEPFSKTGFLCYHPLLLELSRMLSQGSDKKTEFGEYKEWLAENLTTPNSDHDFTIQLAYKLVGETSDYTNEFFMYRGQSSRRYSKSTIRMKPPNRKRYLNLYPEQERISFGTPKNKTEDTYFKWYTNGRQSEVANDENLSRSFSLFGTAFSFGSGFGSMLTGQKADDGKPVSEGSTAKDDTLVDTSLRSSIAMGYTENGVRNRRKRVHYGWPASYHGKTEKEKAESNVRGFFRDRAYSMPQIWGSSVSILRSLAVGYVENMITSYREITGTDAELRAVDVLASMNTAQKVLILDLILDVVDMVSADNTISIDFRYNDDGSKTIKMENENSSTITNDDSKYSNTSGQSLRNIIHDYLKFVSKVSTHDTLQLVNSPTGRTIPYMSFIPVEALDNASNPNHVMKHFPIDEGVANIYFRPSQLEPYYDRLEWATDEFRKGLLIRRSSSGIRQEEVAQEGSINSSHKDFLRRHKIDFQHLDFLTKYADNLKQFQSNLETIEVASSISKLFEDGILDSDEKLGEPGLMVKQIRNRRQYYRANSMGIGERFMFENMPTATELESIVKDAEYIYILGLYEEAWNDTDKDDTSKITIRCNYTPILGDQQAVISEFKIAYMEPTRENAVGVEKSSKKLLDYFHIVRGLDLREHAFSDHTDLIFEDDIVKNDSEVFPWTKDDFEDNKPLKPLDTIWSMSPWVFPRNYFYDTTSYHKYHRVVAVTIPKEVLLGNEEGIPPQHDSDELDLIGTLQWEIVND